MAIINNPHAYTGGAVVFNSQPETQLYANLMAKREARKEAMDQYYQNLHKSINPAGVRTQDINNGFLQKLDDWQRYYMENKGSIINPKTPEDRQKAIQHQSMYQDLQMDLNKSKEAAAHEMEYAKNILSGKANPTDNDLKVAHAISAPIYSREHYKDDAMTQPYSLNDFDLNVPTFDPKQQEEFTKAARMGLTAGKTYDEQNLRRDKTTGQVFIPFEQTYSSDQLKTIGDKAASIFEGSRPAKIHYEHLMHDPNFLIPANKAYQSVYGTNELVDTPKKAAQADQIMAAKAERNQGEELKKDETLAFQRDIYLEGLRQKNRIDLIAEREKAKSLGEKANDVWIDTYIYRVTEDSKDGKKGFFGAGKEGREIAIDPIIAKALTRDGKSPDKLIVTEDGKYVPIFYRYDKDGVLMKKEKGSVLPAVSETLSVPITKEQFKLALGSKSVSPTQRTKEMLNQPTDKTYNYKGKTFTHDQIEKAAKKYNVTVDEYLKRSGIK